MAVQIKQNQPVNQTLTITPKVGSYKADILQIFCCWFSDTKSTVYYSKVNKILTHAVRKIRNEMYYLRNFNSLTFFVDFAPKSAQFSTDLPLPICWCTCKNAVDIPPANLDVKSEAFSSRLDVL